MKPLPRGWVWAKVGEVGKVQLGRQRAPQHHSGPHMRPYLRVANVFEDRIDISDILWMNFTPEEFENYRLFPGDILLNEGQSLELVGRPAMFQGEVPDACFQNTLIRFQPHPGLSARYALGLLRYYLRSARFQSIAARSTNIAHLGAKRLAQLEFPLPPSLEQQRIADKLDTLLARVEACRQRLERVAAILKGFRDAVLEAAVSGELTREWREARGLGHDPGSHAYPLLPLSELVRDPLRNGKSVRDGTGQRVLRLSALGNGRVDWSESKQGDWGTIDPSRFTVATGDFLISRGSGSIKLLGAGALATEPPEPVAFPDTMIRIRPDRKVLLPEFLCVAWPSDKVRHAIESAARTTAGIWKVAQSDLENLLLPVPGLEEQAEIVRRVGELLTRHEELVRCTTAPAERVAAIISAVLSKAFQGDLVPQDPNDEPADKLLARIRESRAKGAKAQPAPPPTAPPPARRTQGPRRAGARRPT